MKSILILLIFILPFQLFSQIRLISEEDSIAVAYAHIFLDNKPYTYSDEKGEFKIDSRQKFDTLKIAHLTFETRLLPYNYITGTTIITLKEKNNMLAEATVSYKAKKRKKERLMPDKSPGSLFGGDRDYRLIYDIGNEVGVDESTDIINVSKAVYVPNEKGYETAVITKIVLSSVDKEIKGDIKYIPFRVNLMTYDTVTKLPKDKIFAEDLLVGKKRGQTIEIDLSKIELVDFPIEGICVIVSIYHTEYYNKNGFNPPAFDIAHNPSGFREYSWGVYNDLWEEQSYSVEGTQCFNWGIEIEWQE